MWCGLSVLWALHLYETFSSLWFFRFWQLLNFLKLVAWLELVQNLLNWISVFGRNHFSTKKCFVNITMVLLLLHGSLEFLWFLFLIFCFYLDVKWLWVCIAFVYVLGQWHDIKVFRQCYVETFLVILISIFLKHTILY